MDHCQITIRIYVHKAKLPHERPQFFFFSRLSHAATSTIKSYVALKVAYIGSGL